MTDEEWAKFQSARGASGDPSLQQGGGGLRPGEWAPGALGSAWAGVQGAAKEAVQGVESIPGIGTIPNEDNKSPVLGWAASNDPNHPIAETAGRWGADLAPTFAIPELSAVSRGAAALRASGLAGKYGPAVARGVNTLGQGLWKGAVGGATASDGDRGENAATGAEFGGGSALTRMAWNALPPRIKHVLELGGAFGAGEEMLGGGHYVPWPILHALGYGVIPSLAGIAASVAKPGVAGRLGTKAVNALEKPQSGGEEFDPPSKQ